ncbi:MAG: LysR family transcriptional regulator [Lachnospiraceae bacterium]|nr:LysR family transcriptional regulator [Lachnospiraceae bacterium]
MDTNLLKYMAFVKTVEYGSFTKASEILHYSQSGISRMINDLETDWNLSLLERSRTGIKLTADGAKLLPYAQSLCEEFQKLQMQADDLRGLRSGLIRIGTFSSVATHWLPKIIAAFQKDYPGIDYELLLGDYAEIEDWILTGRVDCGFLRMPIEHSFMELPLGADRLLAVLPEDHPLASSEKVPLAALCKEPFLLLEKGKRAEIAALFERNDLHPNIYFTTWDDYAIMSMVENGLGVSILPELILKRVPYRVVIKELDVAAYRTIAFCLRDEKTASLAMKRFMDYLAYRD